MSVAACAELVKRGDPDRFLTAMSGPVEARKKLFPLYAFNLEIARAPWVTKEAMIAEMRLQWWLDVIEEIYAGKEPKHHEVTTPLSEVIRSCELPREQFDKMINARRWDVYKEPHENADALDKYIHDTSSSLMRLGALSLGGKDSDALGQYGYGVGVANLFIAIPDLENAQKYPLIDGTYEGITALATKAKLELDASANTLKGNSKNIKIALRSGYQANSILKSAITNPAAVSDGTLAPAEGAKKLHLMWLSLVNGF